MTGKHVDHVAGVCLAAVGLLVLLLLLCAAKSVRADVHIPLKDRVSNPGMLCWFACAETVGLVQNLPGLKDLVARVHKSGGRELQHGAAPESMLAWTERSGVQLLRGPDRDVPFLTKHVYAGTPVIVSVRRPEHVPPDQHAMIITRISKAREQVVLPTGGTTFDFQITFVDPNHILGDQQRSWAWFGEHWTGEAWVLQPGAAPPASPATMPKTVTVHESAPVYPHQLPYAPITPVYVPEPASNQDIKDGVQRPDDLFRFGYYDAYYAHTKRKKS